MRDLHVLVLTEFDIKWLLVDDEDIELLASFWP
jgi:hypothetical protein